VHVRFWGLRSDIAEILTASDLFVLASRDREGLGVAILQAMAYGVPVVATKVGGIPEVVQDGVNGRLVKPRDPEGLAHSFLALIHDRETRERVSRAGMSTFEEHFDARHMIQRVQDVYEECLTRGR
jgi:glycosyltransferase involved in cell wall biosynthesis